MVRVKKTTVMKKIGTCTVSVRSSHMERWVLDFRCRYTWLMIRRPQMVGCDDDDCLYQWVMSILVPCVPPASPNSFSSSIWGALVSKNPHRVVGTVLNVSLDVIRNKQWRHRGKEGKRTLATDVCLGLFYYHTRMLSRVTCTN